MSQQQAEHDEYRRWLADEEAQQEYRDWLDKTYCPIEKAAAGPVNQPEKESKNEWTHSK